MEVNNLERSLDKFSQEAAKPGNILQSFEVAVQLFHY
jgi:hypothetical protein